MKINFTPPLALFSIFIATTWMNKITHKWIWLGFNVTLSPPLTKINVWRRLSMPFAFQQDDDYEYTFTEYLKKFPFDWDTQILITQNSNRYKIKNETS